jgi:hypothetical protein
MDVPHHRKAAEEVADGLDMEKEGEAAERQKKAAYSQYPMVRHTGGGFFSNQVIIV